jgi:hypothetical protein
MAARRIYPSWLPPNPREREALLKIRQMQRLAIVWLCAFIPVSWLLILLTRSDALFVPLTAIWIVAGVVFARHVSASRCPRCGEGFCEKSELSYWYGLLNKRCNACVLSLTPERMSNQ